MSDTAIEQSVDEAQMGDEEELDQYEARIIEAIENELRLYQARVAPLFRELAHVRSLKPSTFRLPLEGIQHD